MKSMTMRDYDRQQRFADTHPYTPQSYSRDHQAPQRSQKDDLEDPERPRKLARYTSPRVQPALPDTYSTHARATGRPPMTGGAAGQGIRYPTADYSNLQTSARQGVRLVKDSPPHQSVLPSSVYRHIPTDGHKTSDSREADLKRSVAMLCCSVCGIDAQGPWRTGPLGPYSLCNACGSLPWKSEGVLSPSSIHEALSLLDNMRLMRLQQTSRQSSTPYIAALLHRLQKGLPESTFSRAEEFFARRSDVVRVPAPSQTRIRHDHVAEQQERARVLQLQQHQAQLQARQLREREAQAREVERREAAALLLAAGTEVRNATPPIHDASRPNGREPLQSLPSPQRDPSRETNIPSTEVVPSDTMLKPVEQRNVTSQDLQQESSPRKLERAASTSALQQVSSSEKGGPSMSTASVKGTRAFPLRTGASSDKEEEDNRSRIIDRRRARNEALRKEYLEQRSRRKESSSPQTTSKTDSTSTPPEDTSNEAEKPE